VLIGSGYTAVAVGYTHTVALQADGSVWAWGGNSSGQLGDGTTITRPIPVQIGTGYVAIAAGTFHTVAMRADGSVWAWGDNAYSQLGIGASDYSGHPDPLQVGVAENYFNYFIAGSVDFSLAVSVSGNGTVTSDPAGIDCGSSCSLTAKSGTSVTLTATPAAGSIFSAWGGACSGIGVCSVSLDTSKAVSAAFFAFSSGTYNLNVGVTGSGAVVSNPAGINCGATCTAAFGANATVTLTATPASGYMFSGWTGPCSGSGTCTVTMSQAKTVNATFALIGSTTTSTTTTTSTVATTTTTTLPKVPGAPTGVMAAAGNGLIVVSFIAPVSTGSSPIIAYTATCNPDNIKAIGAASPITVSGLTNGTPYTCTVSASNNAGTSLESAAATATPTGQASASLSTTALSFGVMGIGSTSVNQSVTLTNTGNSVLSIASIAVTGDFAKATTCGSTLAGGGSCVIIVTFTPTGSGTRTGTLSIASSVPGAALSVSLSGTGSSTLPRLSALTLTGATLSPSFDANVTSYGATLASTAASVTVTASAADTASSIRVNGALSSASGTSLPLAFGNNTITVQVTAADGVTSNNYTIAITRMAPMLAGGNFHTLALKGDGTLWAWGFNYYGQLGDGTTTDIKIPKPIGSGYTAVTAGNDFTLALKADSSLWAWGNNDYGQLGDATTVDSRVPKQIASGYAAVTAGNFHSLALGTDGSVWAWGNNDYGQLGDGTVIEQHSPKRIGKGYTAIAAGFGHSLGLKEDGSLWAWGQNTQGQLGDGRTTNSYNPELVGTGYKAISAAGNHSIALKTDGSLWTWGANDFGQLGEGTTIMSTAPKLIGTGYASIAAGFKHNLALKTDGSLWAWGYNGHGQLGDGTLTDSLTPKQIDTGFSAITAGGDYTVALKSDGTVWALGANWYGQLGDGTLAQRRSTSLVVNDTVDGPLDLIPAAPKNIPADKILPFFSLVSSDSSVVGSTATLRNTTKFNATHAGKPGAVFVTARVPAGSLIAAQSAMSALGASGTGTTSSALDTANTFVLVQLTSSGWQPIVNGQLIPYATGVLDDQLAAQTILDNTDTANLKGAEFCLGYGSSAEEMTAAGRMRTVATILDANATSTDTSGCIVGTPLSFNLVVPAGWNLLGNSLAQTIAVGSLYGDANVVNTVWKWDVTKGGWQFYTPSMDAVSLQTYATGKGYGVLSTINPGEGYWVNAKTQPTLGTLSGNGFNLSAANLAAGWNLVATGNNVTPSAFNASLNAIPPAVGVNTLWAWDNLSSRWYFYAPSLEAQGGTALSDYIAGKGYIDFGSNNKTVGNGTGFWVNR
jgi:alpha-tubulin suppressor-like RCC1 family protein